MAMRLISATGQPLAALALLAALCACSTTGSAPSVETRAPGWRIVERTGVARYMPPENAAWIPATIGQALAEGSEVTTGTGGRLIIDAPRRHLSVGPDSHFVLPGEDGDAWLEQRAGWLRYRIAEGAAQPFRIHTRSLELQLSSGVVDVQINHLATEVTVKEGQVRVATPDGLRHTQMIAGQSARAGEAGGTVLAVRLAPDQPLQPIESGDRARAAAQAGTCRRRRGRGSGAAVDRGTACRAGGGNGDQPGGVRRRGAARPAPSDGRPASAHRRPCGAARHRRSRPW